MSARKKAYVVFVVVIPEAYSASIAFFCKRDMIRSSSNYRILWFPCFRNVLLLGNLVSKTNLVYNLSIVHCEIYISNTPFYIKMLPFQRISMNRQRKCLILDHVLKDIWLYQRFEYGYLLLGAASSSMDMSASIPPQRLWPITRMFSTWNDKSLHYISQG